MIAVDSSALIAILLGGPEARPFQEIVARERCIISAVNAHETACVLRIRNGERAVDLFWHFLTDLQIAVIPFDEGQMRAAAIAFYRFGKGIDSKAKLNLCDCAAYALAKTSNAALLFKGNDFVHTDLHAAR